MGSLIYKISSEASWSAAQTAGIYRGSEIDRRDGFIHFSSAGQVAETAAKHFRGQSGLVLIAVDPDALRPHLKWEPSRGGALFPHLYGDLSMSAVRWTRPLAEGPDGCPLIPALEP